ncbi:uncharacterized protein UV8b_04175 [Ustilaginoidea virens]|uniref:Uncharacterized protein n=1 Tax=Ustilaginoidea virens TaxID=1159556 RepID=A0A8E5HRQ2_USTVR|nr:uncharacterized protein UV8b_04175 [Ustilaginoidea virens]QUC19934.1 hypothetical protein UV8b_04175 [Ustilaginoidea virens]
MFTKAYYRFGSSRLFRFCLSCAQLGLHPCSNETESIQTATHTLSAYSKPCYISRKLRLNKATAFSLGSFRGHLTKEISLSCRLLGGTLGNLLLPVTHPSARPTRRNHSAELLSQPCVDSMTVAMASHPQVRGHFKEEPLTEPSRASIEPGRKFDQLRTQQWAQQHISCFTSD